MVAMRTLIAIAAVFAATSAVAPRATAQDAESSVYAAAKTCAGLRSYLKAYPTGRYRTNAEQRIASDCTPDKPADKPADKPPSPAPTPVGQASPRPPADPCLQARADWNQLAQSLDTAVLRTYLSTLPQACTTQRALAEARIASLQSAVEAQKRTQWNGVPEFDGVWVLDPGTGNGCGNLPWRHAPNNAFIRRIYADGSTRDMKVLSTSPPTLGVRENNKGRAVIEGERMRVDNADGKLACYLKRQ